MTAKDWIAAAQALATLILVFVAAVTLKRASTTLLQPIRTEAFKAQLDELRNLLRFFGSRNELQLRELFGLDQLINANAVWLHDRFFHDVYGITIPATDRPYSPDRCPLSVVSDAALGVTPEFALHPARGQNVALMTFKPGAGDDAWAWWSNFVVEELKLPVTLTESLDQLRVVAASPLMPTKVTQRLRELISVVDSNVHSLFDVLSSAGRQLPVRFAESAVPETFTVGWIADRFYGQLSALEPRVASLHKEIRTHLAIDSLMKPW